MRGGRIDGLKVKQGLGGVLGRDALVNYSSNTSGTHR